MANYTYNPYPQIGSQLIDGLNEISDTLTTTSTVDDLVNAVYNFIQRIYYPVSAGASVPKQLEIEIKSVAYNIINSYNNQSLGDTIIYDGQQMIFIDMMLSLKTSNTTPINAIGGWLLDIEDNLSKGDLNIQEQTPLLLAIQQGRSIYSYWNTKVVTPGSWSSFFETNESSNYANIPFWLVACIEGALIGGNASQKGLIAPTTDIVSVDIISSLIGGLVIGSGKVIFKWVPRIQPTMLGFGGFGNGSSERRKNTGSGSFTLASGVTTSYAADYITRTKQVYYWD